MYFHGPAARVDDDSTDPDFASITDINTSAKEASRRLQANIGNDSDYKLLFFVACIDGTLPLIEMFLEQRGDILQSYATRKSETLHAATIKGHTDVVNRLLKIPGVSNHLHLQSEAAKLIDSAVQAKASDIVYRFLDFEAVKVVLGWEADVNKREIMDQLIEHEQLDEPKMELVKPASANKP
jgi:hypothetical protein